MSVFRVQATRLAWNPVALRQSIRLRPRRAKSTSSSPPIQSQTSIPTPGTLPPLPIWQRLGPLSTAFNAYGRAQRKRPYTTQIVSSLVIYFCGDLAAQLVGGDEYEVKRTGRNLVIGGLASLPSYLWYVCSKTRIS